METATTLFGDSLKAQAKLWLEKSRKADAGRLRKLLELAQTAKIRLSDALTALFPADDTQTALANLTRLRNRLNEAGEGLGLRFQVDTKKKSPPEQRAVWFTGPDATVLRATRFSEEVTADVVGRTFVPAKGIATTGAAMAARKRLVRFFVSYARAQKDLADGLVGELKSQFGCSSRYEVELWMDQAIHLGDGWHHSIQTAIQASEFGLLLIGPEFLNRKYIREHELPHYVGASSNGKPIIPVGLIKVDFGEQDLLGLAEHQIFRKAGKNNEARFYEEMQGTAKKREFVHQLFLGIQKRLDAYFAGNDALTSSRSEEEETLELQAGVPAAPRTSAACTSEDDIQRFMRPPEETRHFQRTRGFAHHLAQRESLDPAKASLGDARDALDELEAWALRPDGSPFFALLGEVGIGKTTTLKQFTRQLIDKRQKEPGKKYPLPLYIDLRDYVAETPGAVPTIEELLTSVIRRAWRVTDRTITAADLLRLVREENALIIFDGLDEKIVHLTQDRARDFIRTLWSVLPLAMLPRSGGVSLPPPSGKLLLSCRSHYFRDVWSQNAMLTGEDREGIDRSHYPAFCLLPFDEQQIKNYLTSFLGDQKRGSEAFDLIASIHNLRDLAERPYLLTLISGRLNELEALQMRGETVNAARLYDLVVRSWLSRDDGKHQLDPAHKRRLMEELAAALWRSGEKQWDVDRLEEWLDEFLHQNPAIASAYAGKQRSLLKEDLRTATFVLRPDTADSQFRFAHTSLQEYFLAAYLVRALKDKADDRWNMPVVSRETLDFLGQILAMGTSVAAMQSLERILGSDCLAAAYLAFQYWLEAIKHEHPEPQPEHVNLSGANFDEQTIRGRSKDRPLRLQGGSLRGVQLNRSRVEFVDLTGADLTGIEARQALFLQVNAANAKLLAADVAGLQWRGGSLDQAVMSEPLFELADLHLIQSPSMQPSSERRVAKTMCVPKSYSGHKYAVSACALNPRGSALVSGSWDGSIKVWDATTGKELLSLEGHIASIFCCAWSPDGTRLLSGGGDRTLKIWDLATSMHLLTLAGHAGPVACCAWSPDGKRLLSGSNDKTLKVWDMVTGRELLTLSGHTGSIECCAWSPDGKRLLSGSNDRTLKVWDVATGRELLTLSGHSGSVSCCAWNAESSRLLSGSNDGMLKVWDLAVGKEVRSLCDRAVEILSCAWSREGLHIISGSDYGILNVWDESAGTELLSSFGNAGVVWACAISAQGDRVVAGSDDGTLRMWSSSTGKALLSFSGCTGCISCCAWDVVNHRILSNTHDGTLRIWDATTGKELMSLGGCTDWVMCCAWSADGTRWLSGGDDRKLKVWNASTREVLFQLSGHGGWITCCAWCGNSSKVISGSDDSTLKMWDAMTGVELLSFFGHVAAIQCCAWTDFGVRLLSGSSDKNLKIWDAMTGEELWNLSGHMGAVRSCAWSMDGMRVLSGSDDHTLKVWDSKTGKELMSFSGHTGAVRCCAWSADSTCVLSGSDDHTLKVWDAKTGKELMSISGHTDVVRCCAWSADAKRLISGSDDNTLKAWDASSGECLWTGHDLPENQSTVISGDGTQILHATPEAWRWLGWEERDAKGRFIRRLPAEVFGPIPGMED